MLVFQKVLQSAKWQSGKVAREISELIFLFLSILYGTQRFMCQYFDVSCQASHPMDKCMLKGNIKGTTTNVLGWFQVVLLLTLNKYLPIWSMHRLNTFAVPS